MSTEKIYGYIDHDCAHHCLFLHHHCGAAAEWQERGRRRSFWWHGQPDSIWSAGGGQCPVESDNVVGDHFYGHLNYAFDRGFAQRRSRFRAPGIETFTDEISARYAGAPASATPCTEVVDLRS